MYALAAALPFRILAGREDLEPDADRKPRRFRVLVLEPLPDAFARRLDRGPRGVACRVMPDKLSPIAVIAAPAGLFPPRWCVATTTRGSRRGFLPITPISCFHLVVLHWPATAPAVAP